MWVQGGVAEQHGSHHHPAPPPSQCSQADVTVGVWTGQFQGELAGQTASLASHVCVLFFLIMAQPGSRRQTALSAGLLRAFSLGCRWPHTHKEGAKQPRGSFLLLHSCLVHVCAQACTLMHVSVEAGGQRRLCFSVTLHVSFKTESPPNHVA